MFKQRFLISHVYLGLYKYLSWHLLHTCEVKKLHGIPVGNWSVSFSPLRCTEVGFCVSTLQLVHWALVRVACVTSITAHVYSFCVSRKSPTAIYGWKLFHACFTLACLYERDLNVSFSPGHVKRRMQWFCFAHLIVPSLFPRLICFVAWPLVCSWAVFSSVNL